MSIEEGVLGLCAALQSMHTRISERICCNLAVSVNFEIPVFPAPSGGTPIRLCLRNGVVSDLIF